MVRWGDLDLSPSNTLGLVESLIGQFEKIDGSGWAVSAQRGDAGTHSRLGLHAKGLGLLTEHPNRPLGNVAGIADRNRGEYQKEFVHLKLILVERLLILAHMKVYWQVVKSFVRQEKAQKKI